MFWSKHIFQANFPLRLAICNEKVWQKLCDLIPKKTRFFCYYFLWTLVSCCASPNFRSNSSEFNLEVTGKELVFPIIKMKIFFPERCVMCHVPNEKSSTLLELSARATTVKQCCTNYRSGRNAETKARIIYCYATKWLNMNEISLEHCSNEIPAVWFSSVCLFVHWATDHYWSVVHSCPNCISLAKYLSIKPKGIEYFYFREISLKLLDGFNWIYKLFILCALDHNIEFAVHKL